MFCTKIKPFNFGPVHLSLPMPIFVQFLTHNSNIQKALRKQTQIFMCFKQNLTPNWGDWQSLFMVCLNTHLIVERVMFDLFLFFSMPLGCQKFPRHRISFLTFFKDFLWKCTYLQIFWWQHCGLYSCQTMHISHWNTST